MVDSSTALIMGLKSFLDHLLTTITDSTVNGAGTQQMEDKERHPDVIDVLTRVWMGVHRIENNGQKL